VSYRPVEKVLNEILDELIDAYLPSERLEVDRGRIGTELLSAHDLAAEVWLGLKELKEVESEVKKGLGELSGLATEVRQILKNRLEMPDAQNNEQSPSAQRPLPVKEPVPDQATPATTTGIERVLVVDDEEPMREIISSMLSAAGYNTRQASSGMEALALLNSAGEFHLIFSGLMKPELDGIALLERSKERYPDMPFIVVTGGHDMSVALGLIRSGAFDYLLKPFEREQLLVMVRRALEHRRIKLENRAYQSNIESLVTSRTEQLRNSMSNMEHSYDITLEVLADALDSKYAAFGHSKRATAFTIAIAHAMGLSRDKIRVIARGAFLHHIGRLAIPDNVLLKPGPLNYEETRIMREHCLSGYHLLKKIPFQAEAAEIVYAHQENFDGTGYPRGLKGEDIPLGARIFSIANTFNAITSDRPYRAAQSISVAREEIKRFSGTQFDPNIVRIFLQMSDTLLRDLSAEVDSYIYRHGDFSEVSKTRNEASKTPRHKVSH